jgi:membrane fusion protein (multidrug efflux system)
MPDQGLMKRSLLQHIAVLLLGWLLAACNRTTPAAQGAAAEPAPEVAVGVVSPAAATLDLSYSAQTLGSREVEVRARVSGILLKRLYREGSTVRQGEVMFEIDAAPFEATVAQDRAALAITKAEQAQARRERDRVLPLFVKGLVSTKERDDAVSKVEIADAQVQAAEASLRAAELQLSYTKVRAPITGIASRESRSEGSLLTADSDSSLLTRIVQIEPLYLEFSAPETEAALMRAAMQKHADKSLTVKVGLDDGSSQSARLNFIDNTVDSNSGTVRLRAVLRNDQQKLWPGQYLRAQVEQVSLPNVVRVPRRVVLSSAQGHTMWLVDDKNVVQARSVKLGRSMGDEVLITEGLQAGDQYVLEGLLKVRPGVTVRPVKKAEPQSLKLASKAGTA